MDDSSNNREQVDRLLEAIRGGNDGALDELTPLIYDELRRLAHNRLRYERRGHTLRTTALVNEAYLMLVSSPSQNWKNRAYFFGAAARLMRQILIQHKRRRSCHKRREDEREDVDVDNIPQTKDRMLLRLDEALYELERVNKTQADIVEKHYFGGLTLEEIAEVMNISLSTVKRRWRHAKAWLRREMEP
jgi:RNA polymerase sigma factor (TIGR02999 family)